MNEILIIVGVLGALCFVAFFAVYSFVSHPSDIDAEETAIVAAETPEEHARAVLSEYHKTPKEESADASDLYAHELP